MKIEEILKRTAKIISSEIEGNYQLFRFGSRARERHDEKSDIDIGILTDSHIIPNLSKFSLAQRHKAAKKKLPFVP